MPIYFTVNFIIFIFIWFIKESVGIRNAELILPTVVQAGTSPTLLCLFDLEGDPLYSVQWYRGQFEFYRFVPSETPPIKIFDIPGLSVDTSASNEHQVTLKNIQAQISGEFSCEITTDAFPFSASCVSKNLTVVDLALNLKVYRRGYRFGDNISANCSLKPTLPLTKLIFHWNNQVISDSFINHHLSYSVLHFNTSIFDKKISFPIRVQLKCSALLNGTYYVISRSVSLQLEPLGLLEKSSSIKFKNLYFLYIFVIFKIIMEKL